MKVFSSNKRKYYRVLYCGEYAKKKGRFGIVDIQDQPDFFNEREIKDGVQLWSDSFEGIKLSFEGKGKSLADFQMSYSPWRLVSDKMYRILNEFLHKDHIQFFPIPIIKDGEKFEFYYMHFNIKLNVLDKKRTGDSLIQPIIDKKRLPKNVDIFCYKEHDPSVFCVSSNVKETLEYNKVTGCEFQLIS